MGNRPTGLDWDNITSGYVQAGGVLEPEVWTGRPAAAAQSRPKVDRTGIGGRPRGIAVDLPRRQVNEIVRRYAAGEGSSPLGKEFGLASNTVIRLLREQGVKIRRRGAPLIEFTDEQVDEMVAQYNAGKSAARIATENGIGRATLDRLFKPRGVKMRDASEATKLARRQR